MKLCNLLQLLHPFINFNSKSKYEYVSNVFISLMREPITYGEEQEEDEGEYYPFPFKLDTSKKELMSRIFSGKRMLSKEAARKVISRFDATKFKEQFDMLDDIARIKLTDSLYSFNIYSTINNLEDVCSNLFFCALKSVCEGLKEFEIPSEYRVSDEKIIHLPDDKEYKYKYGPELAQEVGFTCPCVGCRKSFITKSDGISAWDYHIVKINPNGNDNQSNLLAVCTECAKKFSNHNNRTIAQLNYIKLQQVRISPELSLDIQEKEIEGLIEIIKELKKVSLKEISNLRYDPVAIRTKINKDSTDLYAEIKGYAECYGNIVKQLFMENQARFGFKFNRLCCQIRWAYEDLHNRGDLNQEEIYDCLVEELQKLTKGKKRPCAIIIAFFVQNCEVFDVIAK